jgi:hypothetical protein
MESAGVRPFIRTAETLMAPDCACGRSGAFLWAAARGRPYGDQSGNHHYPGPEVLRDNLNLPRVRQRVRHKRYGTVWKVIEEQEVWVEGAGQGEPALVPALSLRFWKVNEAQSGRGKTWRHRYIPGDRSFDHHWEVLEE